MQTPFVHIILFCGAPIEIDRFGKLQRRSLHLTPAGISDSSSLCRCGKSQEDRVHTTM